MWFSTSAGAAAGLRPTQPLADKVRQFTPNWFAVTMGNGIVSLIVAALPFHFDGQMGIAASLWRIDIALYALFAAMLIARIVLYRDTVAPLLRHPVQSMFLGAVPMGLVPIINGLVLFGGEHAGSMAFALWCVDAAMSCVVAIAVPFLMFTRQDHALESVSAVLLLPIVAPEVAASSAAVLAPHLPVEAARFVIVAGYALWAMSVPLALTVLTVVFLRLLIHKLPPHELAPSSWLALGPIGTGALAWIGLGNVVPANFASTPLAGIAAFAPHIGTIGALVLWGMGIWWLGCAVLLTLRYLRDGIAFNLGWWGFTFPLGVYTAATLSLYRATHFQVFADVGVALAILLIGLWLMVASRTVGAVARGRLFHAPCLAVPRAAQAR